MFKISSRNKAIFIAYITLVINMLSMLILTPFYLKYLGVESYGLYQLIFSIAQYILVLEFGISTVMTRYITQYRIQMNRREEENIAMHCLLIVLGLIVLVIISGSVIEKNIGYYFPNLLKEEIPVARSLFKWMIIQIILYMLDQYFQGVALAYEKYVLVKGIGLIRIILKTVIVVLFIFLGLGVMSIVYSDVIVLFLCCVLFYFYEKLELKFKIKWHYFNKQAFKDIVPLMFALLLQSIVSYANNALDMTILGRMVDTTAVAIYSVAMTFISVFSAVPTTIQSVYLPQVTKMVVNNADNEELTDIVIKPGRVQLILCLGMLCGFTLFGRQFLILWTGEGTLLAWSIALIIMIPLLFPLVQNVCLQILTAKNKRTFRSLILLALTVVNVILTIILVDKIGILGAPIGTALAYVLGNILAMNIYYYKKIGLNIPRMFKEIFSGILISALGATIISAPLLLVPAFGLLFFLLECLVFCIVYAIMLYFVGLNKYEKQMLKKVLLRYTK